MLLEFHILLVFVFPSLWVFYYLRYSSTQGNSSRRIHVFYNCVREFTANLKAKKYKYFISRRIRFEKKNDDTKS